MLVIPSIILAIADEDDRQYMETLYMEFHRLMFSMAWKFSNIRADVEDIVSDSCVSLLRKIDVLRELDHDALRFYVMTTVRNTAIDRRRKQRARELNVQSMDTEKLQQIPEEMNLEGKVLLKEELRCVRNAIALLPKNEREVLRMKFQQGIKDREIAELLDLSENSVRIYVFRARQHLKKMLYKGE